ncbi:MAG TPA: TerB family tellurite resistance protein [Roseibacterium sp.]|nr:TerB family tellurite resistance protein [Roseibacterium sp.]
MFADLLKRLAAPAPEPLPFDDARLALAALLVRIARSDGDYADIEAAHIDQLLAARYNLDTIQTAALRADAEQLESEAPDTVRFTRAIKNAVPHDDRLRVIESLWEIVLADRERSVEENALLRMVASMLGINDRDSNLARIRVTPRIRLTQ